MRGWLFSIVVLMAGSAFASDCIAHRGDNENHLENSHKSLRAAMALGAHGVEFDLQHTKDGVALVMHDSTLERTAMNSLGKICPLKTKIKKLTSKEIRENCFLKNGAIIPTLEEILFLLEDYPGYLFIELKDMPSAQTLALIAQERTGKEDKTRFISFKKKYLKKARKLKQRYPFYGEIKMLNLNIIWPFAGRNLGLDLSHRAKGLLFWARWWKKETGVWAVDKLSSIQKLFKKKVPFITTNLITACMTLSRELAGEK